MRKASSILRSRKAAALLTPLVAALVVVIAYVCVNAGRHNFHTVSPGVLYRSAQMSGEQFKEAIRDHGIKTIINLRGVNNDPWYFSETNAAHELGIAHYDFPLSASQEVSNEEMEKILDVMNAAPKPILLHCKNGADRSGLFSALYLYGIEGKPAGEAGRELTIFCFHFPYLLWRDTVAMDHSFQRFVDAHVRTNQTPDGKKALLPKTEAASVAIGQAAQ
jgi:protein tyrosine phosphatase (PTP) superfamily phosphohydrolase (DUF442 family)